MALTQGNRLVSSAVDEIQLGLRTGQYHAIVNEVIFEDLQDDIDNDELGFEDDEDCIDLCSSVPTFLDEAKSSEISPCDFDDMDIGNFDLDADFKKSSSSSSNDRAAKRRKTINIRCNYWPCDHQGLEASGSCSNSDCRKTFHLGCLQVSKFADDPPKCWTCNTLEDPNFTVPSIFGSHVSRLFHHIFF